MRMFGVIHGKIQGNFPQAKIMLNGKEINFGILLGRKPAFFKQDPAFRNKVLIKVLGFSCNFRERTIALTLVNKGLKNSFTALGSEFIGKVIDVGTDVTKVAVHDRVMGDNDIETRRISPGIPSSSSSKEYLVLHEDVLFKVPTIMTNEEASCFSLQAQTVYGILRKLRVKSGETLLLTAGTSTVTVFALTALSKYKDIQVVVLTKSVNTMKERLRELGAHHVLGMNFKEGNKLNEISDRLKGFSCIVDPFFDIYFPFTFQLLRYGGRYITCGFSRQYSGDKLNPLHSELQTNGDAILRSLFKYNRTIYGHNLGNRQDLHNACNDYATSEFRPKIDSIHEIESLQLYVEKSFGISKKLGKVAFLWK